MPWLWDLCKVCKVVEGKRKAYITLHFTAEGMDLGANVKRALNNLGAYLNDAPPPSPAIRDLKTALAEAGEWGKPPGDRK